MSDLTDRFLDHLWLQERLSANTLAAYRRDLNKIAVRLAGQGEDWLLADGSSLAAAVYHPDEKTRSQARALSACKRFYGWLLETEQLSNDPTEYLTAPKQERTLPAIVSESQIEMLLTAPDTDSPYGLRDKALLELMYASGLRVSEAVKLTLGLRDRKSVV